MNRTRLHDSRRWSATHWLGAGGRRRGRPAGRRAARLNVLAAAATR